MSGTVLQPVASVAVDMPLLHLDRLFDYRVTPELDAQAHPGVRVRVPFAGQIRDGFLIARTDGQDLTPGTAIGQLSPLDSVVSTEVVLRAEIAALVRRVADHWAGSFADVVRLAVPPRHATAEAAAAPHRPPLDARRALQTWHPLGDYPHGEGFLAAIRAGGAPRAFWQTVASTHPLGDWAAGLVAGAAAAVASGRSAVLLAPDARGVERLAEAARQAFADTGFVTLSADLGQAARYRAFLAAARGQVRVVVGTRGAVWAPVEDLGFIGLWDEGNDSYSELHAPYPHIREVAALRAQQAGAALMLAGHARSAEVQALVEREWLHTIALPGPARREFSAVVRTPRDLPDQQGRLPRDGFDTIRVGLSRGPVLVVVPRAGYLAVVVCQSCREPATCPTCQGPLHGTAEGLRCGVCGQTPQGWVCPHCDSTRWRAPVVGSQRTAEELGRAFAQVPVRQSHAGHLIEQVDDSPALVVATPGAEPPAEGGYGAAVIMDADAMLLRPDLRVEEETLRRWLHVCALVRPGTEDGAVMIIGDGGAAAVQALIRMDPGGLAADILADRVQAQFPPAVRMVVVEGDRHGVEDLASRVSLPEQAQVLEPMAVLEPDGTLGETWRFSVRAPLSAGQAITQAVRDVQALRTAHKDPGSVRIRVDPAHLG